MGGELYGKKLGIIGFGRIGREVADRAKAFGMDVHVYDPMITVEDARESNCTFSELDDLVKKSDIITLHVPLNKDTRNMIDEKRLQSMKSSAIIVNIARGGIIDEKALYNALKEKKLRGAVLDVYEKEPPETNIFKDLDNVITTPHLGASTSEAQINAGTVVVEKIRNFFR
jgi:D-3-phosphoglycerate dehydrogenase